MWNKIFYTIFAIIHIVIIWEVSASSLDSDGLKDAIIPSDGYNTLSSTQEGEWLLDYVLWYIRDSIFSLMAVIAIGMFIYIGARLVIARGNQEEFKKALKSFIYAVVGILVVAFAWAIINFVAGLNI